MQQDKISDLPEKTTPVSGDLIEIESPSDSSSKHVTLSNLPKGFAASTIEPTAVKPGITPAQRSGGFKVGTFTVSGTGSQSITGVGFQPKSVIFMPLLADSTSQGLFGLGFWDGTSSVSMNMGARITATSGNFSQEATGILFRASDFSSGAENVKAQATGTSFNSDGFTINVTVSSGSQVIAYIAFG